MNLLRWVAFLPLALFASVIAGTLATIFSEFIGLPTWTVWGSSGIMSAFAFIFTGVYIAPSKTRGVLISLTIIVAILAVLSAAGTLLVGQENIRVFASLGMFIGGWAMFQQMKDEVTKNT